MLTRAPWRAPPDDYVAQIKINLAPTLLDLAGGNSEADRNTDESGLAGTSLRRIAETEKNTTAKNNDGAAEAQHTVRDIVIEYLAEGVTRPHLTLVRGTFKLSICPGDPDWLTDVRADPDELVNLATEPEYAELLESMRADLLANYALDELQEQVVRSQDRRRLVSTALAQGETRQWDLVPQEQERYVRGDFWAALNRGKITDPTR